MYNINNAHPSIAHQNKTTTQQQSGLELDKTTVYVPVYLVNNSWYFSSRVLLEDTHIQNLIDAIENGNGIETATTRLSNIIIKRIQETTENPINGLSVYSSTLECIPDIELVAETCVGVIFQITVPTMNLQKNVDRYFLNDSNAKIQDPKCVKLCLTSYMSSNNDIHTIYSTALDFFNLHEKWSGIKGSVNGKILHLSDKELAKAYDILLLWSKAVKKYWYAQSEIFADPNKQLITNIVNKYIAKEFTLALPKPCIWQLFMGNQDFKSYFSVFPKELIQIIIDNIIQLTKKDLTEIAATDPSKIADKLRQSIGWK